MFLLSFFRVVSFLEGVSYLALFAFSMPLKYWGKVPEPNIYVGYAHGGLFIAYILIAFIFWRQQKGSIKQLLIYWIASLLPFATFYVDQHYLKPLALRKEAANGQGIPQ